MVIYIGADHRGFSLKERLMADLKEKGYEVADMGAKTYDKDDDYPVFAGAVGEKVCFDSENNRGIVICGSGAGAEVAANKFKGVRAALAISPDQTYSARHDDNINILVLAADFIDEETAKNTVKVFLATPFGGDERYKRRLKEIEEIESKQK